jgi:hypothetical protein
MKHWSVARGLFMAALGLFMAALGLGAALLRCGGADAATCNELQNDASRARKDAQNGADRTCTLDSDCAVVDYSVRCVADCGGHDAAVAASAVSSVAASVKAAEDDSCGEFERRHCRASPIPPCDGPTSAPSAVCRGGQCVLQYVPPE